MTWAEKIIALPAWIAFTIYAVLFAISFTLIELAPLQFSFFLMPLAAFLCNGAILFWLRALHIVARSKVPGSATQESKERGFFVNALVWMSIWCVAAPTFTMFGNPGQTMLVLAPLTIIVGYFFLRAIWASASALTAFEHRDQTFQTLLQILYFPIGVWFLHPRLQALLSAPSQPTASTP